MYHFFAMLSRMKYINRWGLMRNTREENICEHSLEVALVAHALATVGNRKFGRRYNPERAAMLAMLHDASEIITGDMPTPVKYHSEEIRKAYAEVEDLAVEHLVNMLPEDLRPAYREIMTMGGEGDEELKPLIKAADKISAVIKCVEERRSGNRDFSKAEQTITQAIRGHGPARGGLLYEGVPPLLRAHFGGTGLHPGGGAEVFRVQPDGVFQGFEIKGARGAGGGPRPERRFFMGIGNVEIQGRAALAPMAGVTDAAYRRLCREFGAAYTVTEMVSAKAMQYSYNKTARLADVSQDQGPVFLQLFGSDPFDFGLAARKAEALGPDGIDVNMGCPVPKVAGNGAGSALMKDPAKCAAIVSAVKAQHGLARHRKDPGRLGQGAQKRCGGGQSLRGGRGRRHRRPRADPGPDVHGPTPIGRSSPG